MYLQVSGPYISDNLFLMLKGNETLHLIVCFVSFFIMF